VRDDRLLPSPSNAGARENRRHRKMQKSGDRVRTQDHIEERIALDMIRARPKSGRSKTLDKLHHDRAAETLVMMLESRKNGPFLIRHPIWGSAAQLREAIYHNSLLFLCLHHVDTWEPVRPSDGFFPRNCPLASSLRAASRA